MDVSKMIEVLKEFIALKETQDEIQRRIAALELLYKEEQISDEEYLKALLVAKADTKAGLERLEVLKEQISKL
jgi:uncharacterized protein YqgQ